mgnify:FL=1
MNEELTTEQAWNHLKELVFKGVQITGSILECEQKNQAIQQVVSTVENALNLKENVE